MRSRTFRAHMLPTRAPTSPDRRFPISYDMRDEDPPKLGRELFDMDRGGCDACVFCSVAGNDEALGVVVLTRDGATRGPIKSGDLLLCWLELTRELAERAEGGTYREPQRAFVRQVWEIAERASRHARVEVRGELGADGNGSPKPSN